MGFVVVRELTRSWHYRLTTLLKICYTLLIVYLNILSPLPTNLIPPDQINTLQPSMIPQMVHGSKLVIGEQH